MGKKPSGTVTFLFTDIEGSTKLAQKFPDEMPALLARHDEILNQAIESHDGFLFKTVGDAYCVAFHSTKNALNAALEAQRQLDCEEWSPAPIKVRMGIHTGTAQLVEKSKEVDYSGYATLALVQRVMSAGHGGQVLLSQTAHDLLGGSLPEDVQLIDMGERQLKDVVRPEHLYQLAVPDLPSEFPALKTLKVVNHNLPTNLTSFIGRERELALSKEKLEDARLLTLIGPGGTGKSRLSVQLGGEILPAFSDGVWLVELAPLADPNLIMQTVASVFGLRESPGRPLIDLVIDYFRAKQLLLLLDNCEHLIEACARLADQLLRQCPDLKIVASSREALGIHGETVYRVPSLSLPQDFQSPIDLESLTQYESVQLFVERASAANSNFMLTEENAASVAKVCRRLDGIPLALELAAARVKVLSVEQIAERLDDRFRLLTGGSRTALPRQQTLQALIDWSYDLLDEPEKVLFRRLAVFVGGWTLEAAESVCAGDGIESFEVLDLLTQLVDKSLVQVDDSGETVRYFRLETIRQYARQKLLESDETQTIRQRHLDYFIQLSGWADENWISPRQQGTERRIRAEFDNYRAALAWTLENQPEDALQLISWVVFMGLWIFQGYMTEGHNWCQTAITHIEALPSVEGDDLLYRKKMLARAWDFVSIATMNLGEHRVSKEASEKCVALAREMGDKKMLAIGLASFGIGAVYSGEPKLALEATEEAYALSQELNFDLGLMWAINTMTHIYSVTEDKVQLKRYKKEAKALLRRAGVPPNPAEVETELSAEALENGDKADALKHAEAAIELYYEVGDKYRATFFVSEVAHALRDQGELDDALVYYRRAIVLWQDFGHRSAMAHQLECFAFIAIERGQRARAVKLFGAADALREVSNSVRTPAEQKEFEEAKASLQSNLNEEEFEKVWNAGRSLTMEQAIELALEANA